MSKPLDLAASATTLPIDLPSESEEDTEMSEDPSEAEVEAIIAKTVRSWLDEHGAQLFALEYSKKAVREARKSIQSTHQSASKKRLFSQSTTDPESATGQTPIKRARFRPKLVSE
uniref:Uncharacterized protein n=1 Tax=Red panda feces-associated crucivirus TaxID=2864022 RepID=A0A8K1M594_9VIRU|nr:hypothetical protein 2 [Red panda feces-associated crucivirus]